MLYTHPIICSIYILSHPYLIVILTFNEFKCKCICVASVSMKYSVKRYDSLVWVGCFKFHLTFQISMSKYSNTSANQFDKNNSSMTKCHAGHHD